MERKIMSVLRMMQHNLSEEQLRELKSAMQMVFANCELVEKTELMIQDNSWICDLDDFLTSKILEGKSVNTISRYRYELNRLPAFL